MDDHRLGSQFRALRIRRGWRQEDLAAKAGVSRSIVGKIERGRLGEVPMKAVRCVAEPLDIRVDIIGRWRGGDLGRLINSGHAAMHEVMAGLFGSLPD